MSWCRAPRVPFVPGECPDTVLLLVLVNVRGGGHRLIQLVDTEYSIVEVYLDLDYSPCCWDLPHVVGEVRYNHELAKAGRLSMLLYGNGVSTMSKTISPVRKFSSSPKVTGRVIFPKGRVMLPFTPWNTLVS